MPLFSWISEVPEQPDSPQQLERPNFLQRLLGTGEHMEAWRAQRQQIKKEYDRQAALLFRERHLRAKDFEKSMVDRRERFMRQAGMSQFVERDPTESERTDFRTRSVMERYEKMDHLMRKQFDESERDSKKDLQRGYHRKLKDVSKQLRETGMVPSGDTRGGTISPLQHFSGTGQSSSARKTHLAI
ncbi:MAG: hypothetical protein HY006_00295 [Candidatus Sungbacteria bacterium]|nr:hypothetical protein [Candidatus Sungbacteria bacterium]